MHHPWPAHSASWDQSDESQNYGEIIDNRHRVDKPKERIERIERRLELTD